MLFWSGPSIACTLYCSSFSAYCSGAGHAICLPHLGRGQFMRTLRRRCCCAQLGGVQSLPQLSHHLRQAGGNYGAEVAAAAAADEVAPPTTKHDPGTPPTVKSLLVAAVH
jgi:hypothetical protein